MGLFRRLSGRGSRFDEEARAGAEFMLRMYWNAVEGVAELLRTLGTLTPPSGAQLIRMELRKPPRPLATDAEALMRLAGSLDQVPELAAQMEAALLRAA